MATRPRRVVLIAFDGVEPVDLAGPSSVFMRARRLAPGSYDVKHASVVGAEARTASGYRLAGLAPLSSLRGPIDTLLIAGGEEDAIHDLARNEALLRLLRRLAPRVRRIGSVCTGAFILAAAGLLDGRQAVTHWAACDALARTWPAIDVRRDAIHVIDGPVATSAGVTAGIDLALALVEQDLGPAIAARIAKEMVLYLRRSGGQSQFSTAIDIQSSASGAFADLVAWIATHPEADLSIPALARHAGMSERTFVRRFKAETGQTPAALVRTSRVDWARRELETTNHPVKQVAIRAGFGSEDSLVRAFRAELNTSPSDIRRRFG